MKIYCCGCAAEVDARLTDGREIYAHRPDLAKLPFWKCDACGNFVGCHHKTKQRTRPLGCIPTPELRKARGSLHNVIDPMWKCGEFSRGKIYSAISKKIGKKFHTAEIRSVEEAQKVYRAIEQIKIDLRYEAMSEGREG